MVVLRDKSSEERDLQINDQNILIYGFKWCILLTASLNWSRLDSDTTLSVSRFHCTIVRGKKEYLREFLVA